MIWATATATSRFRSTISTPSMPASDALGLNPKQIVEFNRDGALIARFFFVEDPDGYKIEVLQRQRPVQIERTAAPASARASQERRLAARSASKGGNNGHDL